VVNRRKISRTNRLLHILHRSITPRILPANSRQQLEQEDPAELEVTNAHSSSYRGLDLPVASFEQANPYQGYVLTFDLEVAADGFSDQQGLENAGNSETSVYGYSPIVIEEKGEFEKQLHEHFELTIEVKMCGIAEYELDFSCRIV
jgi:hypothetical protein